MSRAKGTPVSTMRAALYDRYGGPDVVYVGAVPVPEIGRDEVLVRVRAVSVNGGELAGRAGKVRLVTGRRFPQRLGIDFVGEVVDAGASVEGVTAGGRVWGMLGRTLGSAAEYVAISPDKIAPAPANLSDAEAVSMLAGGTTAMTALRDKARLQPGERLLVRGGSGGVGSLGVQIAAMLGARVTALASAANLDFTRELGADEALDHRTHRPSDLAAHDVVLDTVGTEHRAFRRLLAPGGRMVAIAFDLDRIGPSLGYIAGSAVHGAQRVRFFSGNPTSAMLAELTAHAESGSLRPVVDTVRPFDEIAEAHRDLEAGGVRGKHVLQVA